MQLLLLVLSFGFWLALQVRMEQELARAATGISPPAERLNARQPTTPLRTSYRPAKLQFCQHHNSLRPKHRLAMCQKVSHAVEAASCIACCAACARLAAALDEGGRGCADFRFAQDVQRPDWMPRLQDSIVTNTCNTSC
jgi:hypothetical protein